MGACRNGARPSRAPCPPRRGTLTAGLRRYGKSAYRGENKYPPAPFWVSRRIFCPQPALHWYPLRADRHNGIKLCRLKAVNANAPWPLPFAGPVDSVSVDQVVYIRAHTLTSGRSYTYILCKRPRFDYFFFSVKTATCGLFRRRKGRMLFPRPRETNIW